MAVHISNSKIIFLIFIFLTLGIPTRAQEIKNFQVGFHNSFQINWPTSHLYTFAIDTLYRKYQRYLYVQSDSAIILSKEIIRLSQMVNHPDGIAKGLMSLGQVYLSKEQFETAKQLFNEAEYYCRNALFKRYELMAQWEYNVALPYLFDGQTELALHHLLQAKSIATRINDTDLLIGIHNTIGILYLFNLDLGNAQKSFDYSLSLCYTINDPEKISSLYNNLASLKGIKDDTSKLYFYAQRALAYSIPQKDIANQRRAVGHLGNYYMKTSQFHKSLEYFKQVLSLSDKSNPPSAFTAYRGISASYHGLKQYNQAVHFAELALQAMPVKDRKNNQMVTFYDFLAQLYFDKGDYKQGFIYKTIYSNLSDSVNSIEKNKALSRLEIKSNLAEKDKALTQKQLQLTRQQFYLRNQKMWIIILSAGIFLLSLLFINYRRKLFIFKQQEEINKLKAMMKGEEKERNRVARELHDGISGLLSAVAINFNALGAEYEELQSDPVYQKTEMIIEDISNEIRETAHNLMPDVLLKYNLADAIRLFCSYVKKGENLEIEVLTYGSFDRLKEDFMLSVYRIVQELVHNIVKHAQATTAFVHLHADNNIISIAVEDNGIGYHSGNSGPGMGLKNVQDRVRTLQGTMSIEANKGTAVYIKFDVEKI